MGNFFGCGKSGQKVTNCPNCKGQDKCAQSQASVSPKKNHFYALLSRGEQETFPDVVTVMLKVFTIDVYVFLDPGGTFSFVTPLVATKFDIFPDVLHEPLIVSTPVGESVLQRDCIEIVL